MNVGVVVVAAGRGERLGRGPKALVELAGRPLVAHAVAGLAAAGLPAPVVVHTPDARASFADALAGFAVEALVPGGATRTASVSAGVGALPSDVAVVAVHDAARPLLPARVLRAVVDAVGGDVVAAAPALAVADTLKRVEGATVQGTVDRAGLVGVQTPQAFPRAVLLRALTAAGGAATDDLGLVERLLATGEVAGRVVVVPGSPRGLKVTYPEDLEIAEALLAQERAR